MNTAVRKIDVKKEASELLSRLGVDASAYTGGDLAGFSPVSGEQIAAIKTHSKADAEKIIAKADEAFRAWRTVPAPKRGELIRLLGEELRASKEDLGRLVSLEAGKIPSEGLGEVQEMIDICDFAVGLSRQLYGLTIATERAGHRMMETWHPLGVVGVISAFNFPVAVWSWNTALAIVCGNAVVWKPSEKTLLTALACDAIFKRALKRFGDAPEGVSQLLLGNREIGEVLVDSPKVPLVSATGSTRMGREVGPRLAKRFARSILNWAATMPVSSARPPISTWRCAPSHSAPWARLASAAPHCAACSCMKASTMRSFRASRRPMPAFPSARRSKPAPWSAR